MIITREYIFKHITKRGAWTKVQLSAIGIEWPPQKGWIDRIEGKYITDQQAKQFEQGKYQHAKKNKQANYELFTLQ